MGDMFSPPNSAKIQQQSAAATPPAPLPATPANVTTPSGSDATAALQLRQIQSRLATARSKLMIPYGAQQTGNGVSIPT